MGLNNCMSPSQGPCAESQSGLFKSTYCVGNINTAENNLLADEKDPGSFLVLHLYYKSPKSPELYINLGSNVLLRFIIIFPYIKEKGICSFYLCVAKDLANR